MAETLTVNTDESTPELTAEEQDSLQVGEKMAEEQGELLAGKYKNAEDLEKAYVELQKKLGDKDGVSQEGQETQEVTDEPETEEPKAEQSPAVSLIHEASDEYFANNNQLSKETIEKFSEMSSQDLVNAYLEIQANNPQAPQQAVEMSEAQVNSVQNAAGGEANYNKVIEWAASNLPDAQINAFDSVVDTGNPAAIGIAFSRIAI